MAMAWQSGKQLPEAEVWTSYIIPHGRPHFSFKKVE